MQNTLQVNIASNADQLSDTDNDTKIWMEKNADEDIIRFDLGGMESFRMEGERLEMNNLSNSVYIGERAGESDDSTNNKNVMIGTHAGQRIVNGYHNVGIGYRTQFRRENGHSNTSVGELSLYENVAGIYNTAIGVHAARVNTKNSNTAIGALVMDVDTTGYQNTVIGTYAMMGTRSANRNCVMGTEAMRYNLTGASNVVIGHNAAREYVGNNSVFIGAQSGRQETESFRLHIEPSNSNNPLIYGEFHRLTASRDRACASPMS